MDVSAPKIVSVLVTGVRDNPRVMHQALKVVVQDIHLIARILAADFRE